MNKPSTVLLKKNSMNKVITIKCIVLFCATAASPQTVPATNNGKTNLENVTSN